MDTTRPSAETRESEAEQAKAPHEAGRGPTPEEAQAAEGNDVDPSVAESYQEATEIGASQEGEGKPGI